MGICAKEQHRLYQYIYSQLCILLIYLYAVTIYVQEDIMFELTHSLYEYEKRNWKGIAELSDRHDTLQSHDSEEYFYSDIIGQQ